MTFATSVEAPWTGWWLVLRTDSGVENRQAVFRDKAELLERDESVVRPDQLRRGDSAADVHVEEEAALFMISRKFVISHTFS